MVVTLTGPNDHLRKAALTERVTSFIAAYDDMAIERLDGEEASADRMREALQSLPFLSERKLVVLREPGKQKDFADKSADILSDIADTTDVIIYEPKLDKRSSYYKTLKKLTDFQDFQALDAGGLARWAVGYIKEHEGEFSMADANTLINRVGVNQQLVQSELDKLLIYNPHITKQSIELLTERTPASTIFELLDAAFSGNTKRAFDLYKEQRALKVEPQAIIALMAWQLHILAVVKAGSAKGVNVIAKEAKLNPFVVRKSQGLVRDLSLAEIKQLVNDLLRLDIQLKRSALDADEALQHYLLAMTI
jgi:DNA polymerase III subunit delta